LTDIKDENFYRCDICKHEYSFQVSSGKLMYKLDVLRDIFLYFCVFHFVILELAFFIKIMRDIFIEKINNENFDIYYIRGLSFFFYFIGIKKIVDIIFNFIDLYIRIKYLFWTTLLLVNYILYLVVMNQITFHIFVVAGMVISALTCNEYLEIIKRKYYRKMTYTVRDLRYDSDV
jgi:hypothetical protein